MVAGLLHFSNAIGAMLVAEGIETEAERIALRKLGVHAGQGGTSSAVPRRLRTSSKSNLPESCETEP